MYEQDLDLMDADDASEIAASSPEGSEISTDAVAYTRSFKAGNSASAQNNARARLEAVREERALRKAIYDDLYYLDSDN